MDAQRGKVQVVVVVFKELENTKNNQPEVKNTIPETYTQ